jgi:probable rRNA maturation factor
MNERGRIEIHAGEDVAPEQVVTHEDVLRRAIETALAHESANDATISLTLLGDNEISALNQQYLKHAGPTDVISFPLFERGQPPVGDIYIGYDQAIRQAKEHGVPIEAELARLAIHGTLHVLGYDHHEQDDRETTEMWLRQEAILERVLLA